MRAIDLQTGQDVSSFTPPSAKASAETTPVDYPTPQACEWNAEWGFRNDAGAADARDTQVEGECESDIDDRPEDKLFIGQTCESH